jgi:hypothetical protein
MTENLRLPSEWEKVHHIIVRDPDGWDRKNLEESWNTPITEAQFLEYASLSTVQMTESHPFRRLYTRPTL